MRRRTILSRWSARDDTPGTNWARHRVHPHDSGGAHRISDLRWRLTLGPVGSLAGLRVVLDCANGAVAAVAPRLFEQLGAQVIVHAAEPDGTNINHQCGALFPEQAQELVRRTGADVGFCFDGDADRMIAIDETGTVRDGDYTLGICTQDLVQRGALGPQCIVGTVMSNFGLEEMLQRLGIALLRAPVGDKCVRGDAPNRRHARRRTVGHISSSLRMLPQGTAWSPLCSCCASCRPVGNRLSRLSSVLTKYPQVLLNVRSRAHRSAALPEVKQAHAHAQQMLNGTGRILVRLSGTELLARVMVEGRDPQAIQAAAENIAHVIESAIGATTVIPTEL